jgi:hypothetical protein
MYINVYICIRITSMSHENLPPIVPGIGPTKKEKAEAKADAKVLADAQAHEDAKAKALVEAAVKVAVAKAGTKATKEAKAREADWATKADNVVREAWEAVMEMKDAMSMKKDVVDCSADLEAAEDVWNTTIEAEIASVEAKVLEQAEESRRQIVALKADVESLREIRNEGNSLASSTTMQAYEVQVQRLMGELNDLKMGELNDLKGSLSKATTLSNTLSKQYEADLLKAGREADLHLAEKLREAKVEHEANFQGRFDALRNQHIVELDTVRKETERVMTKKAEAEKLEEKVHRLESENKRMKEEREHANRQLSYSERRPRSRTSRSQSRSPSRHREPVKDRYHGR